METTEYQEIIIGTLKPFHTDTVCNGTVVVGGEHIEIADETSCEVWNYPIKAESEYDLGTMTVRMFGETSYGFCEISEDIGGEFNWDFASLAKKANEMFQELIAKLYLSGNVNVSFSGTAVA